MNNLMKLNYDDYYKFLVSLGIIGLIFFSVLTYYLGSTGNITSFISFWLIILIIFFISLILIGMVPWKKRQKDLDKLLTLEVSEKDILVRKLRLSAEDQPLKQQESKMRIMGIVGATPEKLPEKIK